MKRLLLSLLLFNILHFLNAQTALIPCDKVIDGLVAYYPLDGNANDRSGNGKNGNYIGIGNGLAIDRNGNTNSAYSFDGINFNYLDLGSNSTMKNVGNKFSISVWVEIMGDGINWGRILIGGSVNKAYTLVKAGDSDDRICFRPLIDPGSLLTGEVYTSSSLTRNKWYHVCAVYDGEKTKIYLNGSLNNTTTISSQFVNNNIISDTKAVVSGGETAIHEGNNEPSSLNGKIDDIRIYNRVLSDCEIARIYDCNTTTCGTATSNGLIASYPFCNSPRDVTNNHLDGTILGSVLSQADRFNDAQSAYKFGGTAADVIKVENKSDLLTLSKFSVSFWIKRNRINKKEDLFLSIAAGGWGVYISNASEGHNNKLGLTQVDNDAVYSSYDLNDLSWHHCVVVFNGTQATFYLDGVSSNTQSYSRTFWSCNYYSIGDRYGGQSDPFNGLLDDFKIFDKILSNEEVLALYNAPASCIENNCPGTSSSIIGNNIACITGEFSYAVTSILGINYSWSVPGLGIVGTGNKVSFNWGKTGPKKLYAVPSNTCAGISVLDVTVVCCNSIDSSFTVSYTSSVISECIATLSVTSSLPNNKFEWSTGETRPFISVNESGVYFVKTYNSCSDRMDSIRVTIVKIPDKIPNVITPNHDQVNDIFKYEGCFATGTDFALFIYNRWGQKVYQSNKYNQDWDAEGLTDGIYYYLLTDNTSGKVYSGWLQVLR